MIHHSPIAAQKMVVSKFGIGFCLALLLCSCVSIKNYQPSKKMSEAALEADFDFMQGALEKMHPALYWYTDKDSMTRHFAKYRAAIADSMTEEAFAYRIVAPTVSAIRCGHTSTRMSKKWGKKFADTRFPGIPLFVKIWNKDSMVFLGHGNRRDSVLRRGDIIFGINGLPVRQIVDSLFLMMSTDGDADNISFIRLSSDFPNWHRRAFGITNHYTVAYADSNGTRKTTVLKLYDPAKDTLLKKIKLPEMSRAERKKRALEAIRKLSIDTANNTAVMELNSFTGGRLRKFFRQSFRSLKALGIKNLVIDLRNNGGGRMDKCVLLSKYIRSTPFSIADSCTAATKSFGQYGSGIDWRFFVWLGMQFSASKKADGQYHYGHWEKKLFEPKTTNHFNGDVFVITAGPSFSASTLFINVVKNESNVKLVGETTGGGSYGNSGVFIPNLTLPNSGVRIRVPLFKIVNSENLNEKGQGFHPDVEVLPTVEAIKKGIDLKMEQVKTMIRQKAGSN
jgi:hypothetical protein